MLFERNEDYRCLVFCGDECVCDARTNDKKRILMNLEHELQTKFIEIRAKNVRNVPIKKKKKTKRPH